MKKSEKKKLKEQVEKRLEDIDILGDILVPGEEYSKLAQSFQKTSDETAGKKKKKIIPIITSIIGVLGLAGGGVGLWYGLTHTEPTPTPSTDFINVTLELNGGIIEGVTETIISVKKGSTVGQLPTPKKDHAVFEGWYLDKELTKKIPTDYVFNENISVFANYINNITFTFNLSGGKVKTTQETEYNIEIQPNTIWKNIPKPEVEKEASIFDGWYKDVDCTTAWNDNDIVLAENNKAYAKWNSAIITYQVKFELGTEGYIPEGEGTTTTIVNKGDLFKNINKPNVLSKDSIFSGWYDSNNKKIDENLEITNNITVFAHYIKRSDVEATVKFVVDKEKGETSSGNLEVAVTLGTTFESVNKPTVTKAKSICIGWVDGDGKIISGEIKNNIIAYPKWSTSFTVKFNANGGSITYGKEEVSVADKTSWLECPKPTVEKAYEKFEFWYEKTDEGGNPIKILDTDLVDHDMNVKAYYVPAETSISISGEKTLISGLEYQYSANYEPSSLSEFGTTWSVWNDESCSITTDKATIDTTSGLLQANKNGTIWIKANSNKFPSTCNTKIKVTINNPYINSDEYWINKNNLWYKLDKAALVSDSNITAKQIKTKEEISFERTSSEIPSIYVGDKIVEIPDYFMNNCINFNNSIIFIENSDLVLIGKCFMTGCSNFNQKMDFTNCNKLVYIENGFLQKCTNYNNGGEELILPTNLQRIYEDFLWKCNKFNQNIEIPSFVVQVSGSFLEECNSMTSTVKIKCSLSSFVENKYSFATDDETADCYKIGIKVSGVTQDEIDALFPKSSVEPYRYIIAI